MMCFFFFKQKTSYEMRISDWSSDVCSSDLLQRHQGGRRVPGALAVEGTRRARRQGECGGAGAGGHRPRPRWQGCDSAAALGRHAIGRESCRERMYQYVEVTEGIVESENNKIN